MLSVIREENKEAKERKRNARIFFISQFLSYRWSEKKIKKRSKLQEENFLSFSILILSVIRKENKEAKERKRNARIFFLSQFLSYQWSEKKIKKCSKLREENFLSFSILILSVVREENKEAKERKRNARIFFLSQFLCYRDQRRK